MSIEQDGTDKAREVALALCRGTGATKGGLIEGSTGDKTLMDLFAEQALWPSYSNIYRGVCHFQEFRGSDEALA